MKCVTPMFRYVALVDQKTNKGVISRKEALNILNNYDSNYYQAIKKYNYKNPYHKLQMIGCQECWACQLNKSAQWATRIMCEVKESPNNYFITLTYDDLHLPIAEKLYQLKKHKNGSSEILEYENDGTWGGTLQPKDTEKFMHDIRQYFERKGHKGIKVYYVGEYGEQTHRPHYHFILMNLPLDPKEFYGFHIDGNYKAHWKSKEIERYWDKGMIDIAEVEWSSAAYVARYCMKKLFPKNEDEYYQQGKLPEFTRMSRRPGIGMKYYEEHKHDIYKNDEMIARTVKGKVSSFKPPKAWDKKFKEEFPEEFEIIKKSRMKAAERAEKIQRELSDYTDLEKQNIATRKVLEKNSMLPRPGEW